MFTSSLSTALSYAAEYISRADAEILLAHVLQKDRAFVIAHDTDRLSLKKRMQYKGLVKKRTTGIPLAYLLGQKEFYGLRFVVTPHTLIPRPETELMVEAAVTSLRAHHGSTLIDIGTGTGCIPISIAKKIDRPLTIMATDISKKALQTAEKNAAFHSVDILFLEGNLLEPIPHEQLPHTGALVITANLPYLTEEQFEKEPTIQHEPKSALVAAHAGLALYEGLLLQLSQRLLPQTCIALLEIDPNQSRAIRLIIQQYFPHATIDITQDLAGLDRMVQMTLTNT